MVNLLMILIIMYRFLNPEIIKISHQNHPALSCKIQPQVLDIKKRRSKIIRTPFYVVLISIYLITNLEWYTLFD